MEAALLAIAEKMADAPTSVETAYYYFFSIVAAGGVTVVGLAGVYGTISIRMLRELRKEHADKLVEFAGDERLQRLRDLRQWRAFESTCRRLGYDRGAPAAANRIAAGEIEGSPEERNADNCRLLYWKILSLVEQGDSVAIWMRVSFLGAALLLLTSLPSTCYAKWLSEELWWGCVFLIMGVALSGVVLLATARIVLAASRRRHETGLATVAEREEMRRQHWRVTRILRLFARVCKRMCGRRRRDG